MSRDYEKYEIDCERIRTENKELLQDFTRWLASRGLSEKTIRTHRQNVDFYINHFLLSEDAVEARNGADEVNMFLGFWFIRKTMWASPSAIKSNASSLKKFYTFMYEAGKIEKDDLDLLKDDIREGMPEWLETMDRYDDPNCDIEDIWGF